MKTNKAKQVSICGVMSAVAAVILFLSGATGLGIYAGPVLASLAIIPVLTEFGSKAGFTVYITVGVIAFIICPDREMVLFWMLFAWYPSALPFINKAGHKAVKIGIKVAIFSVIVFLDYYLGKVILGVPDEAIPVWIVVILYILACFSFLVMELIYVRVQQIWVKKYRRIFK